MASPGETRNARNRATFLRNIITVRLINAWWLATFFQPDEFFQSLEPAWKLAFGPDSGAWLTWEWKYQLRSSLHPAIFSGVYIAADTLAKLLPAGNVFRTALVIGSPRALQAILAALGDWYTWQLAVKIFGPDTNVSFIALFLQLFNPWQWYCSTRTFSNSLEATLTITALYYWPWKLLSAAKPVKENPKGSSPLDNVWSLRASLCLAALAVVLRPTNILIWTMVAGVSVTHATLKGSSPVTWQVLSTLVREAILCGSLIVGLSAVSDYLYFGFWTFPPYNWLNFNISKSLAVFYGRNPWHYYLSQGIPLLTTTSLPFALWALYRPAGTSDYESNILRTLSYTILTTVGAMSLISHKEVRFVYPLLPILSIISAPGVASFFTRPHPSKSQSSRPRIQRKNLLRLALGVNALLAGYLSFFHQAAPLNVLAYLRKEYERVHPTSVQLAHTTQQAPTPDDELFALFLMPCHSTPWRSHLYYPGLRAYALTCEPPLHTEPDTHARDTYRDEADRFYDDPVNFLRTELLGPGTKVGNPRYIVGFEGIEPWLTEFLLTKEGKALGMQPTKVWSGFNGLFSEDWRRAGKMVVWDTGIHSRVAR